MSVSEQRRERVKRSSGEEKNRQRRSETAKAVDIRRETASAIESCVSAVMC